MKKERLFRQLSKELGMPFYILGLTIKISKAYFLITILIAILSSVQPIVNVWLTQNMISGLMAGLQMEKLLAAAAFIVISNLCLNLLRSFFTSKQSVLAESFKDDFKCLVGKKIMSVQYARLENQQMMDLKEQALRPVIEYGVLNKMLVEIIPSVLNGVFLLASTAVIVSATFPLLIIPLLLITAFNVLLMNQTKKIKNMTYNVVIPVERKIGYYTELTFDYSLGKDVRLFSMHHLIMDKIRRLNTKDLNAVSKQFGKISCCTALSSLLSQIQICIIYAYIAYQAFFNVLSIADFTFYTGIFIHFNTALFSIIDKFSEILYMGKFFPSYREFDNILVKTALPEAAGCDAIPSVEFKNITFTYPNMTQKALNNLSFSIQPGERIALVGQNGAGKTTIIKLLCGLYEPDSGEIWIGGQKVERGARAPISVVFQDYKIFSFTIYDNIVMGKAIGEDISEPLRKADLDRAVDALPKKGKTYLYRLFESSGIELSGGQGQKLAIARALYKNAPLMILDEPTAALDPVAEKEIYDKFVEISRGKTSLVISHRLSSTRLCDRILVVSTGGVIESGTHEELMELEHGVYREMYQAQAKYYKE